MRVNTYVCAVGVSMGVSTVWVCPHGQAVLFAGPLRHAGYPIVRGTRVILVLFLYVHDFPYGDYIHAYEHAHMHDICNASSGAALPEHADDDTAANAVSLPSCSTAGAKALGDPSVRPSGDAEGGFVVYRQTVELADMLNRNDEHDDGDSYLQ